MTEFFKKKETMPKISVVMPCLNEEKGVGICIEKCLDVFARNGMNGEVIVVDNGSTDASKEIIRKTKAHLFEEKRKGYGSAYLRGFSEARGKYIVMGDSDDTYDFFEIPQFISLLENGYDFIIGSRLKGKITKGNGSMPWLHRFIGNPVLSGILRLFFGVDVSDAHCGMRAFTQEAYQKMFLRTTGMEFASEMIINAGKAKLKIKEIPINYRLRIGESKLRTFRDGWRHLRFMLLYSPTFLFLIPGVVFFIVGLVGMFLLLPGPLIISRLTFDYHYMFVASTMVIIGYQIINLGFFAKIYSYSEKFEDERNDRIVGVLSKKIKLESMVTIGLIIFFAGLLIFGYVLHKWLKHDYMGDFFEVRSMIVSVTCMIIGIQTMFFSFFYSILRIEKR